MKKIVMTFGFIFLLTACLSAQVNKTTNYKAAESGKCFNENSKIVNIGMGLGYRSYYKYGKGNGWSHRTSPAFNISYEQALKAPVGPGLIGIGGFLGYQRSVLRNDNYFYDNHKYYYEHLWTYMFLAVRAAYHADALVFEKGEIYFGAALGLRFNTYRYYNNSPDPHKQNYEVREGSIAPRFSVFAGGRYYLTNNLGAFMELGYGISYLNLGLSIKF
jgi:hypothetical protein